MVRFEVDWQERFGVVVAVGDFWCDVAVNAAEADEVEVWQVANEAVEVVEMAE